MRSRKERCGGMRKDSAESLARLTRIPMISLFFGVVC